MLLQALVCVSNEKIYLSAPYREMEPIPEGEFDFSYVIPEIVRLQYKWYHRRERSDDWWFDREMF